MEEDTEFTKLPVEDRCVHKLWKARVHGYEEATKLFRQIPDEKAPEWNKYLGIVKKFAADSNAAALEKGLEAVLAYIENAGPAGKTVGEVMSNIVTKCLGAPKAKTKELSQQIVLMYVEIEKHDLVMEELIKGFDQKNPKVVAACINTATLALNEFGSKVINVKPFVKEIPKLLDHRDKIVRDEGKALVIEIFRWVGVAIKPQLSNLKPVQVTELEAEFEKVASGRVTPKRYLRSQQQKQQVEAIEDEEGDGAEGEEEVDAGPAVDPFELLDPVDILSKLPKDFYEKLEAKKWQERKESMDELEKLLTQNPKLEGGDYGELVRTLKKIIQKDTNVVIVAIAGKNLAALANGLKKKFQPYSSACVSCVLEKFKEKKQNVVSAMREAIDALSQTLTLEQMLEDITEAIEKNKNPAVKAETMSFLARYFTRCTPQMLDKKMLKAYVPIMIKALNEPDPNVRDNAAEALGTAMKAVTERAIMPFIGDVDNIKLQKIKECCEKAVITVKVPKAARPATAPAKTVAKEAPKPVARPAAKKTTGPVKKVMSGGGKASKPASKKQAPGQAANVEKELADEEIDELITELITPQILADMIDGNWKTRLSAAEQYLLAVNCMEKSDMQAQVLIRALNKKPGLKDGNFQVLKIKFDIVKAIAESPKFTKTSANFCIQDVAEKLGDAKTGTAAADALTAIAETTKLDFVATEVMTFAFNQKSPKVQQESMVWLANALKDFGFTVQPKPLLENVRKALSSTNVAVRTSAITFLGTLYLYMGDSLRRIMESEKPAIVQLINAEFDKLEGQRPPTPIKGMTVSTGEDNSESIDDDQGPDPDNLQELLPRVDISSQITESMINELGDKNWKVRDECLQKVARIVSSNTYITNNLGELPAALAGRLGDSNKMICQTAFSICKNLGQALGTQSKSHLRTILPAMLQGLGDSKPQIRGAAMECIKIWAEQSGCKELFEGEMIADALKNGNPFLKAELFLWLAESLPNAKKIPKEELIACLPYLLASVEDRSADVRKNAQEAILPIMIHTGYEPMVRQAGKLSASSRTAVTALLEKARANLPAKPSKPEAKTAIAKPGKQAAASAPTKINTNTITKSKPGLVKPAAGRTRKEEEQDLSPLLQVNNLKNQRMADEQKLRVLKWNFTTPREEFVDLLKDQMTAAGFNRSLMDKMFHSDFKFHLKVIDSLNEFLNVDHQATVSNLDLILKWLTLRFFDTNPSVLLRGLEYLLTVFAMLAEVGYNMPELEAASFIPYLILKSGDPKDAVRNSVRDIMQQIAMIYPCSKLFSYVMEGLKSKNSRQRTECLDQLGQLIDNYGISVSQPTPAAALKEIARQISDRDNSVRTAALNCVVHAWYQEGEKIYKMIGQISDKDLSLLQERIKRAAKNRPVIKTAAEMAANRPTKAVRPNVVAQEVASRDAERYSEPDDMAEPVYSAQLPTEDHQEDQNSTFTLAVHESSSLTNFVREEDVTVIETEKLNLSPQKRPSCMLLSPIASSSPKRPKRDLSATKMPVSKLLKIATSGPDQAFCFKPSGDVACSTQSNKTFLMVPSPEIITLNSTPSVIHVDNPGEIDATETDHFPTSYEDFPSTSRSSSCEDLGAAEELSTLDGIKKNILMLERKLMRMGEPVPSSSKANPSHRQRPVSAAFRLDYDLLDDLENGPSVKAPQLLKMDLDDINDIRLPKIDPSKHLITSPITNHSATANVELHIGRLCNHNLERSIEACKEVETMMRREASTKTLVALTDQLLVAITNQLQVLQKATAETHDLQLMSVNYTLLIAILRTIFSNAQMATRASQAVIRDVMSSLLLMLVEQKLERFNTEDQIVRLTNSLVVRIIENADHTRLVTAQVRMLHDCISNTNTHQKFTELVMKSLWKVMRVIEQWQDQLDFSAVLREINHFLVDFPSHTWKDKKDLTPLKTIKTLVHTMAQFKGSALLTYLNKEDVCHELNKIINKYISTSAPRLASDKPIPKDQLPCSPHRLTKTTHHQLSAIFKKIGSKDQTKEGLEQLYDFQKMNPDADIAPFLEKASQFFQEYIEKGLKTIEKDRSRHGSTAASSLSSPQASAETPSESGSDFGTYNRGIVGDVIPAADKANYYKEKLKALQYKAGLGNEEEPVDNRVDDFNRNHQQREVFDNLPRSVLAESNITSPPKQTDAASLELIKQRLERLKR